MICIQRLTDQEIAIEIAWWQQYFKRTERARLRRHKKRRRGKARVKR